MLSIYLILCFKAAMSEVPEVTGRPRQMLEVIESMERKKKKLITQRLHN